MAREKPTTPEAFLAVSGVGPAKLAQFGDKFLGLIKGSAANAPPS